MVYKFGLVGEKLGHSYSKDLHNKIMNESGLLGTYDLIEIPKASFHYDFPKLLLADFNGLNVTIPYKENVIPFLDGLSESAKKIGAVNTISIKDSKAYGYNTDYDGFLEIFIQNSINIKGKTAAVLGYGGAAKAVILALLDEEIDSIDVIMRDISKAKKIYNSNCNFLTFNEFNINSNYYDFIINCTPVGMYPDVVETPMPRESINASYVFDLIYNPEETLLLSYSKELGIKCFNGMEMLSAQARKSQEIWLK
jgi:shikimate dehydrogenase